MPETDGSLSSTSSRASTPSSVITISDHGGDFMLDSGVTEADVESKEKPVKRVRKHIVREKPTAETEFYFNLAAMRVIADALLTKNENRSSLISAVVRNKYENEEDNASYAQKLYVHQERIKHLQMLVEERRREVIAGQEKHVKELIEPNEAYESYSLLTPNEQEKAEIERRQQAGQFAMRFLIHRAFECARKSLKIGAGEQSDAVNAQLQQRALIFIPRLIENLFNIKLEMSDSKIELITRRIRQIDEELVLLRRPVAEDKEQRTQLEIDTANAKAHLNKVEGEYKNFPKIDDFQAQEVAKRKAEFEERVQKRTAEIQALEQKEQKLKADQEARRRAREDLVKTRLPKLEGERVALMEKNFENIEKKINEEHTVKDDHKRHVDEWEKDHKVRDEVIQKHLSAFNVFRHHELESRIKLAEQEIQRLTQQSLEKNNSRISALHASIKKTSRELKASVDKAELTDENIHWIYDAELEAQLRLHLTLYDEKQKGITERQAAVRAEIQALKMPPSELGLEKRVFLTDEELLKLAKLKDDQAQEQKAPAPLSDEDNESLAKLHETRHAEKLRAFVKARLAHRDLAEKIPNLEAEKSRLQRERGQRRLNLGERRDACELMGEDLLLHLAFATTVFKGQEEAKRLPLHKIVQPHSLSGNYVGESTQHWYEAYAAGAWMLACLFMEHICEFIIKARLDEFPVALHSAPDINMALCCIIIKCLWGILTAMAIAYVGTLRYEKIEKARLDELAGKDQLSQQLETKVKVSAQRFGDAMKYGMIAFQCASTLVQIGFLFFPPTQAAALLYAVISSLAVGLSTGLMLAYQYREQVIQDARREWFTTHADYFPSAPYDPNNQEIRDPHPVHQEHYFREDLAKRLREPAYKAKLMGYFLAGLCSGIARQLVSLVPFGMGPALAQGVRQYVIPVMSLLAAALITLIVKKVFNRYLNSKPKEESIVKALVDSEQRTKVESDLDAPEKHGVTDMPHWLEVEYAPQRGLRI